MTIKAAAAASALPGRATPARLALPGAVLLLAGGALVWWGTGIFRGEVEDADREVTPGFGGGGTDDKGLGPGGGASGSF